MKKLLIVEDDAIVADIYATEFRGAGFEVETQYDGQAALNRISASPPDAVLLDLDVPTLSGVEIIKRVRAQAHLQKLPIIVLTNAYDYRAIVNASKAGATFCLVKANTNPVNVIQFVGKHLTPGVERKPQPVKPAALPLPSTMTLADFAKTDPVFHAKVAKVFASKSVELVAAIQTKWREFQARRDTDGQITRLGEFLVQLHLLTGLAAVAQRRQIADSCSALEALVKETCEKPKNLNLSTLRTVDLALSFIAYLVGRGDQPWPEGTGFGKVLVVDDEIIARETAVSALKLIHVEPTVADDAAMALTLLEANPYDLVLLDVDMPGMTGFELCGRLRMMPAHKQTAVIFVTGLGRFENQVQSNLCGGNDLIGKPFLLIELAVKCLTYLYRAQLR
jgi:DNA-binding response OmpR family regulator